MIERKFRKVSTIYLTEFKRNNLSNRKQIFENFVAKNIISQPLFLWNHFSFVRYWDWLLKVQKPSSFHTVSDICFYNHRSCFLHFLLSPLSFNFLSWMWQKLLYTIGNKCWMNMCLWFSNHINQHRQINQKDKNRFNILSDYCY